VIVQRSFRILGVDLGLGGPADVVDPIATAYRRFRREAPLPPADACVRLASNDATYIEAGGRRVPRLSSVDATLQMYQQFLDLAFRRLGSHALLHAAVLLDRRGGAFLLAGPSGHGKTSLTLELARRGHGFLSDDFAPLDLVGRRVEPYPRAVSVRVSGAAPLPEPFRTAAASPQAPRLADKILLDVGEVLGEDRVVRRSALLRHVLLLTGSSSEAATSPESSHLEVAVRAVAAREVETRLAGIGGVRVERCYELPEVTLFRLELRHESRPTQELSGLLDSDVVLFSQKTWDAAPDFSARPEAVPIRRLEAAEWLGREWLNRRPGGELVERYGGKVPRLFLELAGALADTACFRLTVGRFGETVDLIEALVDDDGGGAVASRTPSP